ncbi:MepB domain containing protein [Flavobacterium sp. KMS]|uniref:MepB family protein n=1 Tax=Flavobacterium sp. KMS TaxID=1566023 RepID=UPI00057D32BB|nr:MepB family protein [Flavobacterium sp. KMS]KIA99277.1 MepB domain containing protein [Flavobacterium sp. KMS]
MTTSTIWPTNTIHKDLLEAKELLYDTCNLECSQPIAEAESADYGAYTFKINNQAVIYRVAKITPTKVGQFVTLWKRSPKGPIAPFEITDDIDLFIVSTRNGSHFGQFIFPKSILHQKGILSDDTKEGKRAIRVYPPWDSTTSKQAQKTQQWQLDYFVALPSDKPVDLDLINKLIS